jgi:predicted hydrocarbon binding protein
MNRKQFVGALVAIGAVKSTAQAPEQEGRTRFQQEWIKSLMETLDSQVDEPARLKIMEECGRACARRGAAAGLSKAAGGDLDKLVSTLGGHLGRENVRREGNLVHLRYTKCFCPLVASGPERLSKTYCHCSRGWAMEVFGAVTGKAVTAELLRSIKRGDAACEFIVRT